MKFHSTEPKNIKLEIFYFNGWETVSKIINKTIIPNEYKILPQISVSNNTPKGRHETVTITNSTDYIIDNINLAYNVDWIINDYYLAQNLDNPNYGNITDNTKIYNDVAYNTIIEHNYQNDNENIISLTVRYDNGYQMKTEVVEFNIHPIVFDGILPNFTFNIPQNRWDKVTINNTTYDIDNRFMKMEYTIYDNFNKFNPDNVNYGISQTDNSKYFLLNNVNDVVEHYYQNNNTEEIMLLYYFDNGFVEDYVMKVLNIEKYTNGITPEFTTNITPIDQGFFGKIEVIWTNISIEDKVKIEDEQWIFNDAELDTDVFTYRDKQIPFSEQPFTFQTPSRAPFSSTIGAVKNINKSVEMIVRIDNGWRNDTENKSILDVDNEGVGGKVYFSTKTMYEASPLEVTSNISYQ